MAWTHQQLAAAITALNPMPESFGAMADAINAQTVTTAGQPFAWAAAKEIARAAPTGDWARIVARSRLVPALPPASPSDQAILAAINAVEGADTDIIDPTNTEAWTEFQAGIGALETSGDLASGTVSAITALASPTLPAWHPPVTKNDCWIAMGSPA